MLIVRPSFIQLISGGGIPIAGQVIFASSATLYVSRRVVSPILGGTEKIIINIKLKVLLLVVPSVVISWKISCYLDLYHSLG